MRLKVARLLSVPRTIGVLDVPLELLLSNTLEKCLSLTSGTENYTGSRAIIGADITFNNNAGTVYTLEFFRRLLTHEIGHAIGLGDIEGDISPNRFIDDNYDGITSATALATLSNPIAQLIDPLNPAASPFSLFTKKIGFKAPSFVRRQF
ncbi:MAG: hypothetical protein F6J90_24580 [Moorea sp. SIOASIH]|uniref:hypothetical protein n=1 Tax=Moorena sp. SIOASIH TaxID=2607817 RepID=UPI0013B700F3|nr:hypothetical protein [Moorena sp. SIOASIH]NEO39338.1 hypothetical protein [Moorena sp. SIOASIH]